ncbi:MAG: M48 family metallopeptidase [Solirubrobacterales bacterium]
MLLDEQISANVWRSRALFVGFLAIYVGVGWAVSLWYGEIALGIAGAIAVTMVVVSLYGGDDMAVQVAGGKQVRERSESTEFWDTAETMAIAAGIPMPRLYVSPDPSPNAFAAGRSPEQALICVNQGLLDRLDRDELEGVVAHEMAHIRNLDVRLMTYAAVLAGSLSLISWFLLRMFIYGGGSRGGNRHGGAGGSNPIVLVVSLLAVVLAPIAATIIQLAVSRRREFLADATGAELTRYPEGLASALRQIAAKAEPTDTPDAIAHMYIMPAVGRAAASLLSTHPPTDKRLEVLDAMAGNQRHTRRSESVSGRALLPGPAADAPLTAGAPISTRT